ncbi:MAG: hypothetical protein MJZ41_09780 [Bacteroidaceae bacterium]|nr:hypothetical protein [Bacteroidaceae bacterium]
MRKLTIIITDELDTMYDVKLVRSRELFIDDTMTDSEIAAFAKKHAEDISLQNNRAIANYLGVSEDIEDDKNSGFAVTTPNFEYTVDATGY